MKIKVVIVLVVLMSIFYSAPALATEDPYFYEQWYLDNIKAKDAWTVTKGDSSVVVAVVDTGVDIDHPDLQGNLWINTDEVTGDGIDNDHNGYIDDVRGWDFIQNTADPNPKVKAGYSEAAVNHGTFVAGLISAVHDNGFGIKGITSKVKIMPLIVLDTTGYGGSSAVSKAIDYAVANGADIINLSFGGNEYSTQLKNSIINAYNHGVLIVAAGGNALNGGTAQDMTNAPVYPICYDQELPENIVLGVIATDKSSHVASYANYGKGCIDIAAPGEDVTSLGYQDSKYSTFQDFVLHGWRGSSFSSAMVSGGAALLKSVNRSLTAKQMIQILTERSGLIFLDAKHKGKAGQGLLNIKKALDYVLGTNPPATTPAQPTTPVYSPPSSTASVVTAAELYVATRAKGSGIVRVFNSQFQKTKEIKVLSGDKFHGLNLSLADVDYDGQQDIVAGGVKGDQPFIRVLTAQDKIASSFFAYPENFRGGVKVAAGDVDKDNKMELVVAPESGEKPVIKILNQNGKLKKEFLAFNATFKTGMEIAVGDVNGDGKAEIVAAPHAGLMPKIKIFNDQGVLLKSLVVYTAAFTGGVNIALADIDKDGKLDIITGAGPGGGPHVEAFNYQGARLSSFLAFPSNMKAGVAVSAFDWNNDGYMEFVVAALPPGGPHVKVFNRSGAMLGEFFPLEINFLGGVNVAGK